MTSGSEKKLIERRRILIGGIVQGVGFRPFVYRQASLLALSGWVRNTSAGVELEAQGAPLSVASFETLLKGEAPPLAVVTSFSADKIPVIDDEKGFSILASVEGGTDIRIPPDIAVCADCLRELLDPDDRRYRYPFITCTNCGPRYSIIKAAPYDRPLTTMSGFPLCSDCLGEYHDPDDRRFHAQPIACPACGPQMRLLDATGALLAERDSAVQRAVELLHSGHILAIKGIGGYHLAVDACSDYAVGRLRERKRRDMKPFALMVGDIASVRRISMPDALEERLLTSPEAPVVIVRRSPDSPVSSIVAPGNGWLGIMLPYAPVHHLLFLDGSFKALVMTSGNVSDEPVAYKDDDALKRLGGIADYFLLHNRPVHVRSDDSVIRVFQGNPIFYRRSRGYVPRSLQLPFSLPPVLAVGGELKSAVCLAKGERAFPGEHIGDLKNSATYDAFVEGISHLSSLLRITPSLVACDMHPDYHSSIYAADAGLPIVRVQHHHAHMASCMAENMLDGDLIGVVFDGAGYGEDGSIWGGEFLVGGYAGFRRGAHFRPLPLPGGDAAVLEPWRMAISFLYQAVGDEVFELDHPAVNALSADEKNIFCAMLERGINSPLTSSCGRLFDAVASLLGIRNRISYDGQAAIELEALAESVSCGVDVVYPLNFERRAGYPLQIDFSHLFLEILSEIKAGISTPLIARRFHSTLVDAAFRCTVELAKESGLRRVALSGGVFQNRLLTEMLCSSLAKAGLEVYTHRLLPSNDGGLSVGQAMVAALRRPEQ